MSEFHPLGDTAITITVGEGISVALSELVVARAGAVVAENITGVTDVVPSYAALTIHYDPSVIEYRDLHARLMRVIEDRIATPASFTTTREHRIPVRYDGEDIGFVAERTGLDAEEVVRIHSGVAYRVFVIGFVPGFAYMGPLDDRLRLPRREAPRKRVPAGSVAIAEAQTGIYPSETPGGWHLIGTTSTRLFDPTNRVPALFRVGDIVRFEPQ